MLINKKDTLYIQVLVKDIDFIKKDSNNIKRKDNKVKVKKEFNINIYKP